MYLFFHGANRIGFLFAKMRHVSHVAAGFSQPLAGDELWEIPTFGTTGGHQCLVGCPPPHVTRVGSEPTWMSVNGE